MNPIKTLFYVILYVYGFGLAIYIAYKLTIAGKRRH